ncbi:nuclease-related domain-containing protein [Paraburkholderia nemoris]|uniref:nuclease-related domain-containing protein n=1 Tax=Paraburkholderia nemoris TaxID=2793076 RepID=UPI0038BC64BE
MAIEAFCRYPTGATNAAERRVLWRAAEILEQNHHSAVILCDFFCGAQQIDLLIATEITTLLLQVKNYRHAKAPSTNSASWMNPATGESLPNAYTQATNQMLTLKDMLRDRSGIDPGFARAAILFERGIPAGSSLPRSDFRVQIRGAETLEGLLLTHTSERSSRRPWDLAQLRGYAIEERMARLAHDALRKPAQPKLIHFGTQTSSRPSSIDATVMVIDVSVRSASSTLTPCVVAQPTLDRPPPAQYPSGHNERGVYGGTRWR